MTRTARRRYQRPRRGNSIGGCASRAGRRQRARRRITRGDWAGGSRRGRRRGGGLGLSRVQGRDAGPGHAHHGFLVGGEVWDCAARPGRQKRVRGRWRGRVGVPSQRIGRNRRRCGRGRVTGRLPRWAERRNPNHCPAQPASCARCWDLRHRRLRRRRLRGRRHARRSHADHRAAKAALGPGRRKAHHGLTEGSERFTAARATRRFRGVSRSAVRAQPHRAHYNPGRTLATKGSCAHPTARSLSDCSLFP